MPEVRCYAYAEDALSCAVMRRIVEHCNASGRKIPLLFNPGFPENKRGSGNIKRIVESLYSMANTGIPVFVLTDLDKAECAPELLREWFGQTKEKPCVPESFLFRIAEREVEAWLLADREGIASFLGIAAVNFASDPDSLEDPKQHLLNIIQKKGRKKWHRQLLPSASAHVGPEYNPKFCQFVEKWDIARAASRSQSLGRALKATMSFCVK